MAWDWTVIGIIIAIVVVVLIIIGVLALVLGTGFLLVFFRFFSGLFQIIRRAMRNIIVTKRKPRPKDEEHQVDNVDYIDVPVEVVEPQSKEDPKE